MRVLSNAKHEAVARALIARSQKRRLARLPPCSRRSRTSPPGGPEVRPSLTATARDGRTSVRAGMEEWLRQGPNKRMTPNRRAKCRQTRYPDLSTVHENGASPEWFYGSDLHAGNVSALAENGSRNVYSRTNRNSEVAIQFRNEIVPLAIMSWLSAAIVVVLAVTVMH
jgi:hypothetical protein